MANEFRYGIDQNGVRHPVCDDTRVDWSSYAVSGAHNILSDCVESYELQSTSESPFFGHLYVDKTMSVKTSWKQSKAIDSATRNTIVLRSASDHSLVYYSTNYATPLLNAGLHEEIIQNVPAGYYEIGLWAANVSETFSISEIMVRVPTDTDSNYSSPAMSNIELTKKIVNVDDIHISDLLGNFKTIVITGAYEKDTTIANIKTYLEGTSDFLIGNMAIVNANGQPQGVGLIYRYSNQYGGFIYGQYSTDKLIVGRNSGGSWSVREL